MIKHKRKQDEDSRFDVDMSGYDAFMQILEHIEDGRDGQELFPRPSKNADPVQSHGVILFIREPNSIHYFACQRRTTIEFAEIIKCGPRKENLYRYFSNMTDFERNLLCEKSHEKLWSDLLLHETSLFNSTKIKVGAIHKAYKPYIRDLLALTTSITDEPPFEFPKGRANIAQDKSLLGSALRELKEEAGIDLGTCVEIVDEISILDSHWGTDEVKYQTNYFLVKSPQFFEPDFNYFDYDNSIEEYCISKDMHDGRWIELPIGGELEEGMTPLCERLESLLFKIHVKLCEVLKV